MKVCRKCNTEKSKDDFHKCSKSRDALQHWCKICNKAARMACYRAKPEVQRERSKRAVERNRRFVYDYLMAHPCVDCGNTDPRVLTFDHINGKLKNISKMVLDEYSLSKIIDEIRKCEVRCANCHAIKTAERGNWWVHVVHVAEERR